ncbi:YggT family protein [Phenylobacterium sp.]|uniref:YggT family protein n=1 Tax=Phenylobacterium sp. TaxID=1871053 RepID=UPI0025DAE395|nr:YggT family protein [Phenylobacterium sp.]
MGSFILYIVGGLLQLLILAIVISAILSWLVAFNVINLRNQSVYNVVSTLEAVTRPIMRPVQRMIPPLGGVDISPIIVILVLQSARSYLLPWIGGLLYPLIG